MGWLHSRRLQYWVGVIAILFGLLVALRLVFYYGFSGLDDRPFTEAMVKTLSIGMRFDLRLAILVMLPVALMAWFPRWNLVRTPALRVLARLYLALALGAVLFVYIVDFGHFAYLGVRLNATVLRFLADARISTDMLWQSYPVIWITLGWLATTAITLILLWQLERLTLERKAAPITRFSRTGGSLAMCVLVFLGLLGRVTDINLENPVPLRWNDAFFSGDNQVAALGLNPVIFLYDTLSVPQERYDLAQVQSHYKVVSNYLAVDRPDLESLSFSRTPAVEAWQIDNERRPNVMFIMLESLGASAVGAYGNPLNPTPNIDRLAKESWFFKHFYVPVTGTAKTVWASITGIPDVSRDETATRNPLISNQHTLINAFEGYKKLYAIGGNSGWANMNALIRQSIDDVRLYEERHWQSPMVDVWGISDLDLFKESDRLLRQLPDNKPFFAYIQTAGNHRPFTIPKENDGFETIELPLDEVQRGGSRTLAQYNAVRLLDFNIGRLMEIAKEGGYYENTIFVMFGDHNTRITGVPHMPPAFEKLGLESNHVPMLIHAPGLLEPKVFEEAVGLADLLPTIAGLLGIEHTNRTLGRNLLQPALEGERAVPLVLREGSFPVIGAVTKDFLLQMEHDGTKPTLHDLASNTPLEDVAAQHPSEFHRLEKLARGLYETSRLMLYQNVRQTDRNSASLGAAAEIKE